MRSPKRRMAGAIVLSFGCAFILTTMPLPNWAIYWRPNWVAMILIYWCVALPETIGVITAWLLGLLVDVLVGTLLGQHAAGLALVAFVVIGLHRRMRQYPLFQQALLVGLLLLVYQLLIYWLRGIGGSPSSLFYTTSALTSALLWPWLAIIMRDLKRSVEGE